jgi:GH25 family lysozyme M1 (1,4-beta-N-acetylmuramidase)
MGSNVYKNTIARIEFSQDTPATTWNITHNLNTLYPVVDVYVLNDLSEYAKHFPQHVYAPTANTVQLVFTTATAGKATVM